MIMRAGCDIHAGKDKVIRQELAQAIQGDTVVPITNLAFSGDLLNPSLNTCNARISQNLNGANTDAPLKKSEIV